ncbi:H(+)/Cl(-) exchange transporter ClcA [Xanthobacter sp. TB0139]|uniref:H(+)/Cl(-) exchange transporter ClcA n=1 Tax=Xanthobacter sp. TB0139 TaxID=3459178 RepID=UPI004039BFD5
MKPSASETSRQINDLTYYIIAAVIGALTGIIGAVFHILIEFCTKQSFRMGEITGLEGMPLYLFMAVFSSALFCGAVALVRNIAPEASGSGVQEIEGAMQGLRVVHWARVLPVKFVGGLMVLAGGLVAGREGPTIHMGASLATAISTRFTMGVQEARGLLGAGGAAGLASAFNAPMASILFIIEEARTAFPYNFRTYCAVILACAFSSILTMLLTGTAPYMELAGTQLSASYTPVFMVLGAIFGVIGVVFNHTILKGLEISGQIGLKVSPYLVPLMLGVVIGPLVVIFPDVTGGGEAFVVSVANNPLPLGLLGLILLFRFFFSAASYSAGAPGGIFAPILSLATTIGVLLAGILELAMPLPAGGVIAFAVASMAALFASTVRAPLVGVVLVLELTGAISLAVPVLVASVCSSIVANALGGRPIYELLLERTLRLSGTETAPREKAPALAES